MPLKKGASQSRGNIQSPPNRGNPAVMGLTLAWCALIGWGVLTGRLHDAVVLVAISLCALTFLVYSFDKNAAQRGQWRTQENTLHLLSALGGWPGAWLAQQMLRHKTRKTTFQVAYWFSVVAHWAALLGWLFWLQPKRYYFYSYLHTFSMG
jgi:uncharacterized membrane protein YsdA (DUF1294 family)